MTSTDIRPRPASADSGPLKGDPREAATPQPRVGGWHWTEWACEFVGTAFQLFLGFSVVALLEAPGAAGVSPSGRQPCAWC